MWVINRKVINGKLILIDNREKKRKNNEVSVYTSNSYLKPTLAKNVAVSAQMTVLFS